VGGGTGLKIALHVPRASYLEAGTSGDPIFLHGLISGLRERGHEVENVSRVDVRDYWRGRLPARRLVSETIAVRRRMKRFSPDAWLVYGPSATYPDVFGWWQRPGRYVLIATGIGKPERMPRPWRWAFANAHRRSLARADTVAVYRPKSRKSLRALGIEDDRILVLPLASPSWKSVPAQDEARRRLGLPLDAPIVLSVSRLPPARTDGRPWKTEMVLELLAAGASLPRNAMLVHVGDGPRSGAGRGGGKEARARRTPSARRRRRAPRRGLVFRGVCFLRASGPARFSPGSPCSRPSRAGARWSRPGRAPQSSPSTRAEPACSPRTGRSSRRTWGACARSRPLPVDGARPHASTSSGPTP
jgi:hypothetical protein